MEQLYYLYEAVRKINSSTVTMLIKHWLNNILYATLTSLFFHKFQIEADSKCSAYINMKVNQLKNWIKQEQNTYLCEWVFYCTYTVNGQDFSPDEHQQRPQLPGWTLEQL